MWSSEKFLNTLFFAIKAHNEQKMKFPVDMPYSAHIIGVLQFAIKGGINDKRKDINWDLLTQAALLHDVIEDTGTSYETVKKTFGRVTADGVMALTKNDNLVKELRMKDSVSRIKKQPKEIAMVKLADRLMNMQERVPSWSKEKQESYKKEAQLICDELGYSSKYLKQELQNKIDNY